MAQEIFEQGEFARRERDGLPGAGDAVRRRVSDEVAEDERAGFAGRVSPQQGAQPRQ